MTNMTKAQLVDENIRLRAQCEHLERKLQSWHDQYQGLKAENEALSTQLSDARVNRRARGRAERPSPLEYSLYWDYVRAEKAAQRGAAVVSYLTREQFDAAREAA